MSQSTAQNDAELERRLALEIVQGTNHALVVIDEQGCITFFNPAAEAVFGYSAETILGESLDRLIPEAHRPAHQGYVDSFLANDQRVRDMAERVEVHGRRRDGEEFPASVTIMRLELPEQTCLAAIVRDMSTLRPLERERYELARAVEQSRDMVWVVEPDGVVHYVNEAFVTHTGYAAEECIGRQTAEVFKSDQHDAAFYRELGETTEQGEHYQGLLTGRRRNGELIYIDETISPVFDGQGQLLSYIATGREITERMEQENQLRSLAYYDGLTQLPNRYLLQERAVSAIGRARREQSSLAVFFIDLDGFKQVNDQYGHKVGDAVLAQVARQLQQAVRDEDTLARIGGDEFLLLAERVTTSVSTDRVNNVKVIGQRLLQVVEEPIRVGEQAFALGASIGVSLYPDDGEQMDILIAQADEAMYCAKLVSGSTFHFYAGTDVDKK
ncbi:MAG: diguanylate cyclase [Thiohalospira sp.]